VGRAKHGESPAGRSSSVGFASLAHPTSSLWMGVTMMTHWRPLAFAVLGSLAIDLGSAEAQVTVSGGQTVVMTPADPVVVKTRRPWRARNRYYAMRPSYPPAAPGARAHVTFEPFTARYYPTPNSYYPPLENYPAIRAR
jgi:hypothetical protein